MDRPAQAFDGTTSPRSWYAEVAAINEHRRIALERIDNAPFSWSHAKICFVVVVGFFVDAYNMFSIGISLSMLGYIYGNENGDLSPWLSTGLKVATPVGNLVGHLLFGYLADILGRKYIYGAELIIMTTATFGQTLAGSGHAVITISVLILWRFIMGIGCGGDQPLSAIIMSEFSPIRTRGRLMTTVIAAQAWGQLAASLVGMIIVIAYRNAILDADYPCVEPVDCTWRLLIGFGCIPGLIAYYCRLTIPETPRFTMDIERNITRATRDISNILSIGQHGASKGVDEQIVVAPRASLADFTMYFSKWDNLLSIPFYGLVLNSSALLTYSNFGHVNGNRPEDVYESLFRICTGSLVLTLAGYIPGFWASFFFIDLWGRKPIQLMGFTVLTVLSLITASTYVPLTNNSTALGQHAFTYLYCLTNFFLNFGPNTTTYIIPGEAFPTRYRATAHGISAACGKLGAIIAQLVIGHQALKNFDAVQIILQCLSFAMFTGILSTLLIPETKQKSLEDLSNESQASYITGVVQRGVPPMARS